MSRAEPRARPAWPPSCASRVCVPVEVVGWPVSGEGRTPRAGAVGRDGLLFSAFSGVTAVRLTPMLRFRKAMDCKVED